MKDDQCTQEPLVLQYAVEYPPNQAICVIHFSCKLPRIDCFEVAQKTEEATFLRKCLLGIDGVVGVDAEKQSLELTRGGVYRWPRIINEAVNIIRSIGNYDTAEETKLYE